MRGAQFPAGWNWLFAVVVACSADLSVTATGMGGEPSPDEARLSRAMSTGRSAAMPEAAHPERRASSSTSAQAHLVTLDPAAPQLGAGSAPILLAGYPGDPGTRPLPALNDEEAEA
jgi:hypothetical protein